MIEINGQMYKNFDKYSETMKAGNLIFLEADK